MTSAIFCTRGDGIYDLVLLRDGRRVELKDFAMTPQLYEGQDTGALRLQFRL